MSELKVLRDKVAVKRISDMRSHNGIALPMPLKEYKGHVIAVGEGKELLDGKVIPPSVKVGDLVVFSMHAGGLITHKGEEIIILPESSILAILDENEQYH